jgi:hypothetical protein
MGSGFGGVCCVFDDDTWLTLMVGGCYPAVDRLFFLVNEKAWSGGGGDNISTLAAIASCEDPNGKIVVVRGRWPSESVQRNFGLEICARAGLAYCFVVDSDEVYDPSELEFMMSIVRSQPHMDAWYTCHVKYWKSFRYRLEPIDHGLAFIRVGHSQFVRWRQIDTRPSATLKLPEACGVCHHLTYARTDQQVLKKHANYSLSRYINPDWFDRVWRAWDDNKHLENLHPYDPERIKRAVLQNPERYPPALRTLYENDLVERIGGGDVCDSGDSIVRRARPSDV